MLQEFSRGRAVSVTLRPTGSLELPSEQGILFAGSQLLPIERCRVADEQEVMERYLWAQAPVIFTRAMDSWPAMRKWSFDFFAQHMGDEQVIAKDDLVSANAIRRVKMREFLLYCRYPFFSELGKVASSRPFYVSYPPFGMHPELLDDIRHPGVLKNSYLQLQGELTETENRVSMSRQAYNESVRNYNTQREIFPNSLVAGFFNFAPASLFEITDPGEREVPKVSFT